MYSSGIRSGDGGVVESNKTDVKSDQCNLIPIFIRNDYAVAN
jgi:hypothetical protein